MSRVEVISSPERRRRWSEDQKRAIVAEALRGARIRGFCDEGMMLIEYVRNAVGL